MPTVLYVTTVCCVHLRVNVSVFCVSSVLTVRVLGDWQHVCVLSPVLFSNVTVILNCINVLRDKFITGSIA